MDYPGEQLREPGLESADLIRTSFSFTNDHAFSVIAVFTREVAYCLVVSIALLVHLWRRSRLNAFSRWKGVKSFVAEIIGNLNESNWRLLLCFALNNKSCSVFFSSACILFFETISHFFLLFFRICSFRTWAKENCQLAQMTRCQWILLLIQTYLTIQNGGAKELRNHHRFFDTNVEYSAFSPWSIKRVATTPAQISRTTRHFIFWRECGKWNYARIQLLK